MARTDTLTNYLTDIADAIREKTGSSDPIQASSFDTAIENLPSGGGEPNWSEIGYSGTPDYVMTAFNYAKDIYDNWDSSQTSLNNKFGQDQELVFMPLVDTTNAIDVSRMFEKCYNLRTVPSLNISNATSTASMFSQCSLLDTIGLLDTSKSTNMNSMFYSCQILDNIPQLDASSCLYIRNTFYNCQELKNFGGLKDLGEAYYTSQGENYNDYKLDLSTCNSLTHESLMNVINNLYDIKTKGCNNQKLQLGSTNLAKLTAEEIAIATNKGWNVVA